MASRRRSSLTSPFIFQTQISRTSLTTSDLDTLKKFLSGKRSQGLIDSAELFGKIKVLSNIRNSDTCLSTALSPDGKYYAVALANGLVNVYNSGNDNLIYTLNKPKSSNIHQTNTTSTCVRFRPFRPNNEDKNPAVLSAPPENENKPDHHRPLPRLVPSLPNLSKHLSRRRSSFRNESFDIFAEDESCSKDYLVTATFADGTVKTFRFLTDERVQVIEEGRETLSMEYDPPGRLLVTSGGDGVLHVYDTETGQRFLSYKPPFNENGEFRRVYSICFNPIHETEFLAGGLDGKVRFYDTRRSEPYNQVCDQFITGEGVAFHPSGNEFCTASWHHRNTLQIFDHRSSKRLRSFDNFGDSGPILRSSRLYSAKYYQGGKCLVIGGAEPASFTVIDSLSGKALAGMSQLRRSVYSLDVCQSKVVMVTGNEVALLDFFL